MRELKLIVILGIVFISFNLKSQVKKNNSNIIDEFYSDLNHDGIKDKIVVYKNLEKNTDFEQQCFQLPIIIYQGTKSGYKLWGKNISLMYDNQKTCTSEGYSNIVIKNNFFTIESQSCYDYNILISSYMTFKVINNRIFLFKYSEEYFDKSNHNREIPSKFLTLKNFGNIEFDQVSIKYLIKKIR